MMMMKKSEHERNYIEDRFVLRYRVSNHLHSCYNFYATIFVFYSAICVFIASSVIL
jgi:hypothetical protein